MPLHQTFKGRPRRYCSPTCRKAAWRDRSAAWAASDPPLAPLPTLADMCDGELTAEGCRSLEDLGVPSPSDSTVADVAATIREAQAVATALRRHGLAAEGLVAVKCAGVASALDRALAEHFGDVLKT